MSKMIELRYLNGRKIIVSLDQIARVAPSPEGCHVTLKGESHFGVVTNSYDDIYVALLDNGMIG